jgi:acyl carrier protein
LFGVDWVPAADAPTGADRLTLWEPGGGTGDARGWSVAERVREWLAVGAAGERLVVVTREAASVVPGDQVDGVDAAAVWGLVRSVQAEEPGRVIVVDADPSASAEQIRTAAASVAGAGDQAAVRDGRFYVPRLTRRPTVRTERTGPVFGSGSVVVTGGLSGLGSVVARHLVVAHGVRGLVLAGRRGTATPGADRLVGDLEQAGAQVTVVACDVSDRDQVRRLLDAVPRERPVTGIVHCAAVLDDGVLTSLDRQRWDRVLAVKADAAWHLHELTAGLDLAAFVMFSSAAGVFGNPGQANYAAANTFLDALAAHRRARDLPAVSIAWGLWADAGELTAGLNRTDLNRMNRSGVTGFTVEEGLELFDAACAGTVPHPVPVRLDLTRLRQLARAGQLPAIYHALVPPPASRTNAGSATAAEAWRQRLVALDHTEQHALVLDTVRRLVATVLAHTGSQAIDPDQPFTDLGFDSLTAVELRNHLTATTALALPATLVFDYPTPTALALHLHKHLDLAEPSREEAILSELDRIEAELVTASLDHGARNVVAARLKAMMSRCIEAPTADDDDLDAVTADTIFEFIDKELGIS